MMNDNTLIQLSAFSGLAGAILSQVFTGLFAFLADKRKAAFDSRKAYKDKQVEVAERFYFVTGETMGVLKKSIEHWKDRNKPRSDTSVAFFNKEIKKLEGHLEKLNVENWKHNLVGLYFEVSLSYDKLIAANARSHALYLALLDIGESIRTADRGDKEVLIGKYHLGIFDLCSLYEEMYCMLEMDLQTVRTELMRIFHVK